MSRHTDDTGRAAVYAAEIAAFDGTDLEVVLDVDTLIAAIHAVVATDWWPGGELDARAARSDARSSTTRACLTGDAGSTPTIRIARPQATVATAAHELAHALAGVGLGHGPRFRAAHLDVVSVITNLPGRPSRGTLHVDQLADAYAAAALEIGDRDWPEPPAVGGPIAL